MCCNPSLDFGYMLKLNVGDEINPSQHVFSLIHFLRVQQDTRQVRCNERCNEHNLARTVKIKILV